jgi:hypothetical protein
MRVRVLSMKFELAEIVSASDCRAIGCGDGEPSATLRFGPEKYAHMRIIAG